MLRDISLQGAFSCFSSSLQSVTLLFLKPRKDANLQRQWVWEWEKRIKEAVALTECWLLGILCCVLGFFLEEATEAVSPNCQKVMEKVHDNLQGIKLQSQGHWWNYSKWTHTVHSASLRIYTINGCKTHFLCKSLQLRLWAREEGTCSPLSASCSISLCLPSSPSLCN